MKSFQDLKVRLKKRWLEYYRHNREWITKYCQENCYTSVQGSFDGETWTADCRDEGDGDGRFAEVHPPSELIIGVITALEPVLAKYWLVPFVDLYPNKEKIVAVLGLNFDPDLELARIEREEWEDQQAVIEPELLSEADVIRNSHYLASGQRVEKKINSIN